MDITPHTRKALYRIIAIIICLSFLVNASPIVAGPDARAAARPADQHRAWGNPRPAQSDTSVMDSWNQFWVSHVQPELPDWRAIWDWVLSLQSPWIGTASETEETQTNQPTSTPSHVVYARMSQTATATPSPPPEPDSVQAAPQDILPPGQTDIAPPNLVAPFQLSEPPFDELFLIPSWNLLSTPKEPLDTDPATFFSTVDGSFNQVFAYDACDTVDPWKQYDPADPPSSDLTTIDHKIGFWIEATAAVTLPLTGTIPPTTTIELCEGWNLIGLPLEQSRPIWSALASIEGKYSRVFGYDPTDATDPWEFFDVSVPVWVNDLLIMHPGRGYWILATENTTLTLTNEVGPIEVRLTSPDESALEVSTVTFITDVVGTVAGDLLQSWTLSYRMHGEEEQIPFATGNTPVMTDTLGSFDPTLLLNGLYEISLTATDLTGQSISTSADVVVEGEAKIGHFTLSFIDLEIPVAGIPIQVIRTYDSRDKRQGDFGFGWTLSLKDVRLQENGIHGFNWQGVAEFSQIPGSFLFCVQPTRGHIVTVTLPDNTTYKFQLTLDVDCTAARPSVVNISYAPLPGTHATLVPLGINTELIVGGGFPNNPSRPPASLVLQPEPGIPYDPDLYELTLQDGRSFVISQEDGLQSVTDLNGNTLTFNNDGIIHSSGKSVDFVRDDEGRITSIADPNNNPMTYGYDANGDLVSFTDREQNTTTFTYLDAIPHHLDGIEDPRGIMPIRNEYDDNGRLLRHVDAFGNVISYTHSIDTRIEIVVDRTGAQRVLAYDARGNVVRETDPKGNVTLRSFDANDNRTCETEVHGPSQSGTSCEDSPGRTLFLYDDRDNLLRQTDAEDNETTFTYNARDQVETIRDPRMMTTTNVYDDANGNLLMTIDAAGNETVFTYNAQGDVESQTVTVGGQEAVTTFEYDSSGNLTKETDAEGNEITFTYDANGNRETGIRKRTLPSGAPEVLTTTFTYDKLDRLVRTEDPDGSVTRTVYNKLGKQEETFDKLGRKMSFEYDEMGQLMKITYPDMTTEKFTYDSEGRRKTATDRGGRETRFEYDELGRLVKTVFPDMSFTENFYDAAGRLEQSIDARGKITHYEYDKAGRRTKIIDPLQNETVFAYDPNGNQVLFRDPKTHETTFEYDELNRRVKTIFPDTTFTQTDYDELGSRIREIDQAGKITESEYDLLGRLTKVIQHNEGQQLETIYTYDEVDNRIAQSDANNHTTRFEYDALGRETKRILPDGLAETKEYDAAGNLKTWTKFDRNEITYDYDSNNRLIRKNFPDSTSVDFAYTAIGQRQAVTDTRGVTMYEYDIRDRLQTLTYPDGRQLRYGYDANGNRTSLTAVIGATVMTTSYTYDDASRLDTVTDSSSGDYDFDWDANGNRERLAYPNGTTTAYQYNTLNRLTDLTTIGPAGTIQSYQFTLEPAGNRRQIDEADGTTRTYAYDDLYRLTTETITNAQGLVYRKTFDYDNVGNRLTQETTGQGAGNVGYTYDDRDRLLTGNATNYDYDDNGNLISKSGEATYTWDFEDRLIQVEKNDGTVVENTYDTDGVRVRIETIIPGNGTAITNFLVDIEANFSHVVAETDETGVLVAYYVRGGDILLSIERPSEQRYYHGDELGSIRFLSDESGIITDSYTYTAFGERLGHAGTDPQPYQFAGEPFSSNVGFYYNRARWLDPNVGRFVGADLFEGSVNIPSTLHKYVYTGNNPINKVDPGGQFSVSAAVTVASLVGTLAPLGLALSPVHTGVLRGPSTASKKPQLPDLNKVLVNTHSVQIRNSRLSPDRIFERLAAFTAAKRVLIVRGPPVTGVGQDVTFSFSGSIFGLLQDDFSVRSVKFRSGRFLSVVTLEGHPLAGWRFWRVLTLPNNDIVVQTGAVEHPFGILPTVGSPIVGNSEMFRLWRIVVWEALTFSRGIRVANTEFDVFFGKWVPEKKEEFLSLVR
ncbi:hypothetical protein KFU94_22695 [Chloroflexi bacterium TSY]|nr:hypothetical protein [Chloroflexi bacterium TSY]